MTLANPDLIFINFSSEVNFWRSKYRENLRIQRPIKYRCTVMDQLKVKWTWPPIPGLKKTRRKWHNLYLFTKKLIEGHKQNLCVRTMQYTTSWKRDSKNKTNCRRKSSILYRRSKHTDIILDQQKNPCKQRHIRLQIKIHVYGREIFLPEQQDGQSRIYHDTDIHYITGIFGKIKSQGK